jgi:hypothetical protein
MMSLILVLVGIVTSAVVYYITSSMVLAQKQLVAANRLQAYLKHWNQWVLDNEWFAIFNIGREWSEEEHSLIAAGTDAKTLVKLRDDKKQFLAKIQQQAREEGQFKVIREGILTSLRSLPKDAAGIAATSAKMQIEHIVQGHTFITDEEAATLGIGVVQEAVDLKMNVIDLIDRGYMVIASFAATPDALPDKDLEDSFAKMFWLFVLASRGSTTLLRYAQLFTTRTVTELTLRNIRRGSRFTKR